MNSLKNYNKLYPCICCGYCCKKATCNCGEWDEEKEQCRFLIEDNLEIGTFKCAIYNEIKKKEKNNRYPMFDCGCSSPLFNNIRESVLQNLRRRNKC